MQLRSACVWMLSTLCGAFYLRNLSGSTFIGMFERINPKMLRPKGHFFVLFTEGLLVFLSVSAKFRFLSWLDKGPVWRGLLHSCVSVPCLSALCCRRCSAQCCRVLLTVCVPVGGVSQTEGSGLCVGCQHTSVSSWPLLSRLFSTCSCCPDWIGWIKSISWVHE